MANITDHRSTEMWRGPDQRDPRRVKFCVTEISSLSLVLAVLGISASLWLAIAAVV